MKITKNHLRELIKEQYAAIAKGGSSPMKSRASDEFAKLVKGIMHESDHDDHFNPTDEEDLIDDLTMQLINLFNTTGFVDLDVNDLVLAVFNALSYSDIITRDQVAKAFGKAIYRHDER